MNEMTNIDDLLKAIQSVPFDYLAIGDDSFILQVQQFILVQYCFYRLRMEEDHEKNDDHFEELLERIRTLLKRQNLCHNTYIFKKMHSRLTVPLSLFIEETSIAKISTNTDDIIEALEYSKLARVINRREVTIIEFPTVKINISNHEALRELQQILEEKDKKYEISKRFDTDKYINLTVFDENILWLEKIIKNLDKEIDYEKADLMEDLKFGVDRIRKLKIKHAKNKTALGKVQYSLNTPPEIFIRKAIDNSSSDQQQETNLKSNGISQKNGNHKERRNYLPKNSKRPQKARILQQDFPCLA